MRVLFDFSCNHCGKTEERFVDTDTRSVPCSCGELMVRDIATPTVSLEGITGAFPGAHDKWARIREEKFRKNIRNNHENGE